MALGLVLALGLDLGLDLGLALGLAGVEDAVGVADVEVGDGHTEPRGSADGAAVGLLGPAQLTSIDIKARPPTNLAATPTASPTPVVSDPTVPSPGSDCRRRRSRVRIRPAPDTVGAMPLVVAVLLLAATNALDNRITPTASLPVNLVVAGLLLLLARWDGLTASDLGLSRLSLGSGLRWGGIAAGLVLAAYLVALLVPAGREAFLDERADLGVGGGLYQAFVQVPFATVLLEELAFRGVLLAMMSVRWGTLRGVIGSSLLFGLWHVLPSASAAHANPLVERWFGTGSTGLWVWAAVSVLATSVAGVVFCWLRLRSGSLLASAGLHWATNGFGFLGALLARGLLVG